MSKIALITGVTGQDGSYLSKLLLSKGYIVHGIARRSSTCNTERIDNIFNTEERTFIHYGDLANGIENLIYSIKPDYIFNTAAMSHVKISFDVPVYTADVVGVGVIRILESIRRGIANGILKNDIRFLQCSSSEMFGITDPPQNEESKFQPQSPYGVSKLMGYWATKLYRTGYNMFACNSICFNHESECRGINFVTKKITRAAARILLGLQDKIELGNLDAKRDWGHAEDYVRAMEMIINHSIPDDFVIATGFQYSVREFAEKVFAYFNLDFYKYLINNDILKRPNEVPSLLGDSIKLRKTFGWEPKVDFNSLVIRMCSYDYEEALKELSWNKNI
jgi:GDPmannose 4,6-dehydratase